VKRPVVLTVAGLDPSGAAGLLADVRTIRAAGCEARAVVTTITAQGDMPVSEPVAAELVARQLHAAMADGAVAAVKIGALGNAEIVATVRAVFTGFSGVPLVIDPVFRASSGLELLDAAGRRAFVELLLPVASVCTPNTEEAAELLDMLAIDHPPIVCRDSLTSAAANLAGVTDAVVVKGGHLAGANVTDVLANRDGTKASTKPRITGHAAAFRGTGCRLSAGIAAGLANGQDMAAAWAGATTALRDELREQAAKSP
jgi:hydroxymethylpyrimidine/phosphomethylpyrimidine kinase